jgi:SOS-response transcriptional repressor LexA
MNQEPKIVQNRRRNLKRVIEERFDGSQVNLVEATNINQGELSALLRSKPFGEKKARKLEESIGLPIGYLDKDENQETITPEEKLKNDLRKAAFTPIQIYPIRVVNWSDIEKYLGGDVSVATRTIHSTLNEEGAFAITLEDSDDSMEPEFKAGSVLIVNPNKQAKSGSFILARAKTGAPLTVKQLMIDAEQQYLKPVNPRYPVTQALDLVVEAVVRQLVVVKDYTD